MCHLARAMCDVTAPTILPQIARLVHKNQLLEEEKLGLAQNLERV